MKQDNLPECSAPTFLYFYFKLCPWKGNKIRFESNVYNIKNEYICNRLCMYVCMYVYVYISSIDIYFSSFKAGNWVGNSTFKWMKNIKNNNIQKRNKSKCRMQSNINYASFLEMEHKVTISRSKINRTLFVLHYYSPFDSVNYTMYFMYTTWAQGSLTSTILPLGQNRQSMTSSDPGAKEHLHERECRNETSNCRVLVA